MSTTATLVEALGPLRADPSHAAILLDVDGTLAPIVRHAEDAVVSEALRSPLIEVARRYAVVACISGRTASDARALVAIGSIGYIGNHGGELLRPGATRAEVDPELERWQRRVQDFAAGALDHEARRLRVRVEDKGSIVAFHYRGSPDEDAAAAVAVGIAQRAEEAGLRPHWGRKVLEVRPPVDIDKGVAVSRLVRELDVNVALYAGDDLTDLDAFAALATLAAEGRLDHVVRVGVRSPEGPPEIVSQADAVVDGVDGVRRLLDSLVAAD